MRASRARWHFSGQLTIWRLSLSARACLRLPQASASPGQSAGGPAPSRPHRAWFRRGYAHLHVLRPIASRVPRALEPATDDEHTREEPHQIRHGTWLRTSASSRVLLAPRAHDRWRRTGRALAASEAGQVGTGRIPTIPVVRRVPAPLVLAHNPSRERTCLHDGVDNQGHPRAHHSASAHSCAYSVAAEGQDVLFEIGVKKGFPA